MKLKVGLIDIDSKIPNLALMKLAAWHKLWSDKTVELTTPIFAPNYDFIYVSKVFTWTSLPALNVDISNIDIGGSGWGDLKRTICEKAESLCPDYSLYPGMDYSMGFLTRGCPNNCPWCIVPEKEGAIKPAADITDFLRHKKAILLDNNVLAHEHGIKQIEKIIKLGVRVDFNQGLDARLIDDVTAKLLAKVKWIRAIRLACDTKGMKPHIEKAVKALRAAGFTREIWCYLLVTDDVEDAHERAEFLRGLDVMPFAMVYRDREGNKPGLVARNFARWVNVRKMFMTFKWDELKKRGAEVSSMP